MARLKPEESKIVTNWILEHRNWILSERPTQERLVEKVKSETGVTNVGNATIRRALDRNQIIYTSRVIREGSRSGTTGASALAARVASLEKRLVETRQIVADLYGDLYGNRPKNPGFTVKEVKDGSDPSTHVS